MRKDGPDSHVPSAEDLVKAGWRFRGADTMLDMGTAQYSVPRFLSVIVRSAAVIDNGWV